MDIRGYPEPLVRLIEELGKLPGIGPKSAERIVFHILRLPDEEALGLAEAVRQLKREMCQCSKCFNLGGSDPCEICSDSRRDHSTVCVVEQPRDLISIERTGSYRGVYHVLGGHLAPLEGIEAEDLTLSQLADRSRGGTVKEVIIATNPNMEGDTTALEIVNRLKGLPVKITRIARGIPAGSQIEYASEGILTDAMEERREM